MARIIVVKCGGAAGIDAGHVCADIAALTAEGNGVVLVHGGSATIDELAARLQVPVRELVSPTGVTARHTDQAMLEVTILALAGKVRAGLLIELGKRGVPAIGMSGLDAGLLRARRKTSVRTVVDGRTVVVRDDHSGRIKTVAAPVLRTLIDAGLVPVVSSPAVAEDGEPVNVNADRVAAAVASSLGADALVLLTAAPGLLADPGDPESLLADYEVGLSLPEHARNGMAIKLIAAGEALAGGVGTVVIADARIPGPVAAALRGGGTRVRPAALAEAPA